MVIPWSMCKLWVRREMAAVANKLKYFVLIFSCPSMVPVEHKQRRSASESWLHSQDCAGMHFIAWLEFSVNHVFSPPNYCFTLDRSGKKKIKYVDSSSSVHLQHHDPSYLYNDHLLVCFWLQQGKDVGKSLAWALDQWRHFKPMRAQSDRALLCQWGVALHPLVERRQGGLINRRENLFPWGCIAAASTLESQIGMGHKVVKQTPLLK